MAYSIHQRLCLSVASPCHPNSSGGRTSRAETVVNCILVVMVYKVYGVGWCTATFKYTHVQCIYMEDKTFQAMVVEGFQITIPKSTRAFKDIKVGDFVDVTIGDIKRTESG